MGGIGFDKNPDNCCDNLLGVFLLVTAAAGAGTFMLGRRLYRWRRG